MHFHQRPHRKENETGGGADECSLERRIRELEAEVERLRQSASSTDATAFAKAEGRLAAERVQLALDAGAIVGTWVWDVSSDQFTVDERFTQTFGLDPDLGPAGFSLEQVLVTVHPEDLPDLSRAITEAVNRGGLFRHQYRVRRSDGVYRWVEASGRVDPATEETGVRFPGVLLDIEDRRAAEAERDRANAVLSSVIEAVPGVVFVKDREGRMLIANQGTADLIGLPREEIIGKTDLETLRNKEEARIVMANDRRIMEGGRIESIEERVSLPNGEPAIWLSSKAPFRNEKGEVIGLIGASIDISGRKSAEAALAASEASFRTLADTMPHMVWAARPDGHHDYYNARWYEFTGMSPGSTDGAGWNGMFHPEDRENAWECWRRSLATGDPYEVHYRLRRYDGTYRWTLGRALPLRDASGEIIRWFGTCTDIHDSKKASEVLARSRDELEALVEKRTAALMAEVEERRRAEEAMRQGEKLQAIGQLTGGIAHDFNNMLQVVASGVAILRMPNLPPDRMETILDGIAQATSNAQSLTSQLLSFARRQSLKPVTFHLNDRLRGMAELLGHSLGSRVKVETRFGENLWPITLDPAQLETAVLNLAVNSRDAMPKGGTLTIETSCQPADGTEASGGRDYVRLTIRDTGEGVPPEVLPRVIEPFFTTKPLHKGTGLGLAQVHGFIKQSGGDMLIESRSGEGTAVTLLLPRAPRGAVPEAVKVAPVDMAPVNRPAGRRVLVVDDNREVASFVGTLLTELGYVVQEANSACTALAALSSGRPVDAVFSDIVMPGDMNGVGLAEAIRRDHPHVAVVLATGYSDQLAKLQKDGAFEVLAKPYRIDDLSAALERALAQCSPVLVG